MVTWYPDGSRTYNTRELFWLTVAKIVLAIVVIVVVLDVVGAFVHWLGSFSVLADMAWEVIKSLGV